MELKEEVKDAIINYIQKKNINEIIEPMPNRGYSYSEMRYEIAYNESLPNYIFVVSEKYTFHNGSISDKRWGIYAFDKETGNLIKDFEEKGGCYVGFFNELQFVEKIL